MINKKPVLLIDQDDVLAEYIKAVTVAFNKKYSTKFTIEDCNSWDLESVFGKEIYEVMHQPQLFRTLEPVPGALEVFERLYKSDLFEIFIVTAANPTAVEPKYTWLQEHLPFFPLTRVMVCSVKYMVKGDFLLDDGMHNIKAFSEHGGTSIVFNRPHNILDEGQYDRVNSWVEFEKLIMYKCYGDLADDYFKGIQQLEKEAI